jgi:4-amino-4-deoxy-L-arabinose transferase-like glycosyltransferase
VSELLRRIDWPAVAIIAAISAFHVWGIQHVPFHPDETSYLYQSADLEAWLTNPLSLAWDPRKSAELDQQYRTLNPPLPKVVLGAGRRIAGFGVESVAVDWNWSKDWAENVAAGALPGEPLLTAARRANVLLLTVSLILVYMSGLRIGGRTVAIVAVLLLGTNSLVLLHARRAMAEASVVFAVCLAAFGFLQVRERPWLAGVGAATAALSKLSIAALAPVGLALAIWPDGTGSMNLKRAGTRLGAYLGAFVAEVLILDPLLWRYPVGAVEAVWQARLEFTATQLAQINAIAPSVIMRTPIGRLAGLLGNIFVVPLQFEEAGNYMAQTQPQVVRYLAIPGNDILRGSLGGGITLSLCLLGLVLAGVHIVRASDPSRFALGALALTSTAQAVALYLALAVPFQRYYMPLIPLVCLWAAYGLKGLVQAIGQATAALRRA